MHEDRASPDHHQLSRGSDQQAYCAATQSIGLVRIAGCSLVTAVLSGLSCFIAGWIYTAIHLSQNVLSASTTNAIAILTVAAFTGAIGTLIGAVAGAAIGRVAGRTQSASALTPTAPRGCQSHHAMAFHRVPDDPNIQARALWGAPHE